MAHNPHIDQLGPAVGEHYVGKTNASGIQEYKQMDPDYFLHGADIKVKLHSFYNDEEGSNKPAVYNSPANPPANPAPGATLQDLFDDYFVYWRWNDGTSTWDKLTEEYRYYTYQLDFSGQGTSISYGGAVIHTIHQGWKLIRICVGNESATNIAATTYLLKRGTGAFGPAFAVAAFGSACANFAGPPVVAAGDFFQVDPAAMPAAPVVFAVTITLQRP